MDLGDAAQGVGVLYARALAAGQDLGALCEKAHVFGHLNLSGVAAGGVHPLLESVQLSGEGGQRQGADQIGHPGRLEGVIEVERAYAGHGTGAVGQAKALLAHQGLQGLDAASRHGVAAGEPLPLIHGLSPAQEHQGHVGQRG